MKYTFQITVQNSGMVILRMFRKDKWIERAFTVSRLTSRDQVAAASLDVVKMHLNEMEASLDSPWG